MILSTLVTSQLHFEMCAGLYGHPVYQSWQYKLLFFRDLSTDSAQFTHSHGLLTSQIV